MKTIFLLLPILFLTSCTERKFSYGEQVKIIDGFYRGCKGFAREYYWDIKHRYLIELEYDCERKEIKFDQSELEDIN